MKTYDILRRKMLDLIKDNQLESEDIIVRARALKAEEAIGNPEYRDYPLIVGRERMMQAEFKGAYGQAYTDMYGNYKGKLIDVVQMELANNFRRAIFISSLNAVMRYLGLTDKTIHCKDNEPVECGLKLIDYITKKYGHPRVALVGFQPRLAEYLAKNFELKITDMDKDIINTEKYGVIVQSPEKTSEHLNWCDVALVTGTTIVNDTIDDFLLTDKPTVFYGVTISGAAIVLGLEQYCHCGK